jgi:hypothetical protein
VEKWKDAAIKSIVESAPQMLGGEHPLQQLKLKVLVTQVVIKPLLIQTLVYELSEVQEHFVNALRRISINSQWGLLNCS